MEEDDTYSKYFKSKTSLDASVFLFLAFTMNFLTVGDGMNDFVFLHPKMAAEEKSY